MAGEEGVVVNELPSVRLMRRFLALCLSYGTIRAGVRVVAVGRSTGLPGLPENDKWVNWDAGEMQAAVDYLERKCGGQVPDTAKLAELVDDAEQQAGDGQRRRFDATRSAAPSPRPRGGGMPLSSPDGSSLDAE